MKTLKRIDKTKLTNLENKVFLTDSASNIPKFPDGSAIPAKRMNTVIKVPQFIILETDVPDTYVVRRPIIARGPDLWSFTDKIKEKMPAMSKSLNKALKKIEAPGCSNCKKGRFKKEIYKQMIDLIKGDFTKLDKSLEPLIPEMTRFQDIIQNSFVQDNKQFDRRDRIKMNREPCLECVGKHLAQAYVLLKEAEQGYPDHKLFIKQHIKEANRLSEEPLTDLIKEVKKVPKAVEHINKAKELIESKLDTLPGGLKRWIAIGHLAEASDECIKENAVFANEIRDERIKLMEDPKAEIPIQALLNKAKSILNAG